jgi:hypothetical protein
MNDKTLKMTTIIKTEINDIFALTPPKQKTGKKKCTFHRLLTSESFIAEKRLKKQEKEEKL